MDQINQLNIDYNNFVDEEWEDPLQEGFNNSMLKFENGKSERDLFLQSFNKFSNRIAIENSFHKKAEKHYSLTVEESFLLFFYTTTGSNHINDFLRNYGYNEAPLYIKKYTEWLDKVLQKLPSFDQQEVIHQSFLNKSDQILRKEWKIGHNKIKFPSFISSHKGEKWGNRPEYYIRILTNERSRGKDITQIKEEEQEVLFMSRTEFENIDVNKAEKKIVLKELLPLY